MTNMEMAKSMTVPLFATRETVKEAYDYAMEVAHACGVDNKMAVITAIHVLMNTIAQEIERNESTTDI